MRSRLEQVAGCGYVGEGQPGVCMGNGSVLGILTMLPVDFQAERSSVLLATAPRRPLGGIAYSRYNRQRPLA